jgi:hypothetical protein
MLEAHHVNAQSVQKNDKGMDDDDQQPKLT